MKKSLAGIALVAVIGLSGCTAAQKAQAAYKVIEAIVAVAQAEAPNVPAADQAGYSGFVTLAGTLADQLNVCIGASGSRSAKLLACFNSYASGLSSPTELAQLRILSPAAQKKVQLYVAGITAGVNVAVRDFGGSPVSVPAVAPAPTKAELHQLADRVGYHGGF